MSLYNTKEELISAIADNKGCSKSEAKMFYEAFLVSFNQLIKKNGGVTMDDFGSFNLKLHKGRKIPVAFGNGSCVAYKDCNSIVFKPSAFIKRNVKYLGLEES